MLYDPIRRKAPPPIVHHSSQLLRGSCKTGVGGTLRSEPWTAALCAGGFYCEHPRILELPHGWASEPTGDQPVYGSGGPLTAVQSSGGGLACADRSSAVWTRQASVITFGVLWHFSGGCTIISPVLGRSSRGSMRLVATSCLMGCSLRPPSGSEGGVPFQDFPWVHFQQSEASLPCLPASHCCL
ncbi:PREDICTED: uncharacterized protein LOC108519233 isoform X2 [Rhinopithecus bieti]|uniref:uncharacterized protein LOC108519233 isoform X2 n=1 Tax=Rhinopithecus bieti TaxID=61621 RepID=UPI00083C7EB6|nr:PREDICTED: uncharacterized protein LOC108519233 isoform X2 [Rhinopithecus bieti]